MEESSYNGRMNIGVRSFSGAMASCRSIMVDTFNVLPRLFFFSIHL